MLQRAPAKAAVYGVVIGATRGTTVSVTVTPVGDGGSPGPSGTAYMVQAQVELTSNPLYARWKALLTPAPAGGNVTITAKCGTCAAPTNGSTLVDVTFGDVWCVACSHCRPALSRPRSPAPAGVGTIHWGPPCRIFAFYFILQTRPLSRTFTLSPPFSLLPFSSDHLAGFAQARWVSWSLSGRHHAVANRRACQRVAFQCLL